MFIFPLPNISIGDLLFFYKAKTAQQKNRDDDSQMREAISAVSFDYGNAFHVGIIVDEQKGRVIHAAKDGVVVQNIEDALKDLSPEYAELCHVELKSEWKRAAISWALKQLGSGYNDLFSPDCINSEGKRAFYCCQLAVKSYAETNDQDKGLSPFPKHELNFLDSKGELLPFWLDYYRKLSPQNPHPPQGQPGSHPSKLRSSQLLTSIAIQHFYEFVENPIERMRKFTVPNDLLAALHFVNGARINLVAGKLFKIIEPRNGNLLAECKSATGPDITLAVRVAFGAQKEWGKTSWIDRQQILNRTAILLREHVNELSGWEVRDNGKPISEAKADILSCADTFEYFAGVRLAGEHFPYDEQNERFAYTRREPYGVVGAIGAWNYPIQTASWKIAPAIACGNSIVYKPSPLAPISSVLLALLLQCAGLPDGVVNILQGEAETGAALCVSPLIRKVSFTGSVETGKAIAKACASENIKPVTLELGGKSACIVLEDAVMEVAVHGAMLANFLSQGQVCSNASKILVHKSLLDEFTKIVVDRTENLRIGDPLNDKTHVGACISLEHLQKVQSFIDGALKEGAKLLTGGERINIQGLEGGFYLSPCILTDIRPDMRVYKEEIFGPVMLIIPFDNDEEALKMANDTEFGLAGGIFTRDLRKAHLFASKMKAGNIYINSYNDVHPHVPFGGFNQSGYGRENGEAAIWNYTQIKSVYINVSNELNNPFT
uniref:Aldehyde dehydrogenase domain-containing protein n=1 Tax=Meloidogyne incognita TaxID=6306 RepID=A0A914MF83_MELIC